MYLMNLLDATTQFHDLAELPTGAWVRPGDERVREGGRIEPHTVTGAEPLPLGQLSKLRELRRELLREEYKEYRNGEADNDIVEVVDGLLDVIVIAWGTLLAYVGEGKARAAAAEVGRSNLSKVDGSLGPIVRRDDGKLLKPAGWTAPDIAGVLR